MSNQCKDCGKITKGRGERCHSCAAKVAWERGDHDSPEIRRKQSEAGKAAWARGDYDSPITREKMSVATRMRWERGDYDNRDGSEILKAAWARGAFDNLATRRRFSEAAKARWAKGDMDDLPEAVRAAWERGAYANRIVNHPPYKTTEAPLIAALDICGIAHISQHRPDGYTRIYDEFVPPDILIEVHGDYWHGPKKPKTQKRDIEKAVWAEENGYRLVIIWEYEIRKWGAWSLVHERILPLLEE